MNSARNPISQLTPTEQICTVCKPVHVKALSSRCACFGYLFVDPHQTAREERAKQPVSTPKAPNQHRPNDIQDIASRQRRELLRKTFGFSSPTTLSLQDHHIGYRPWIFSSIEFFFFPPPTHPSHTTTKIVTEYTLDYCIPQFFCATTFTLNSVFHSQYTQF